MNQASIRGPDELLEPAAQGRLAGDEPKLVSEAPTLLLISAWPRMLAEDASDDVVNATASLPERMDLQIALQKRYHCISWPR